MAPQVSNSVSFFDVAHQERVLQELAPRSFFSKASEGLSVAIDALSLGRNGTIAGTILKGTEAVAKAATAVGGMVVAGGVMAFASGGTILKSSASEIGTAYEHGNWEGGFLGVNRAVIGGTYSAAGAGMVVAQGGAFASAAGVAAVGVSLFAGGGLGLYGAVSVYAGYGLTVNHLFRHELNQHLADPSDPEQLANALEWVRSQVRVGSFRDLQKKWDRFANRTSEACCRYVRETVDLELIEKVRQGDARAIEKAQFILKEVKRENGKQLAKNWLLLTIGLIGIAAVILGILFASGPFSPLLLALAAALWFFIDSSKLHQKFCNFCCGTSRIPPPETSSVKV